MESGSRKGTYGATIANAVIAVVKFIVAITFGSSAMFAEAIHSVVDTGNVLLLLHGIKRSERPPDEKHPFGHGPEIYFWGLIVAVVICGAGAGISILEGVLRILNPEEIKELSINYAVLGIAAIFESISLFHSFRTLRKNSRENSLWKSYRESKNPAVFAIISEDIGAISGIAIAAVGITLTEVYHNPVFDAVASVLVGLVLTAIAAMLAYEVKSLLVGEGLAPEVLEKVMEMITRHPLVKSVDQIFTQYLAPEEVLLVAKVRFKDDVCTREIVSTENKLEADLRNEYPRIRRVYFKIIE